MIEVRHLRHEYNETVAIENLSLFIPKGEAFGLIGPNGAGKTTLIRILATLMEPTYGEVRIAGIDALAEPLRTHPLVGYMSDFFSVYENMLVWEYLDHFAGCYGIPRKRRLPLTEEVLELVSLSVRHDALISTLSRGMRQRLCFAKTLLHEPQILLLDEPASGLDPAGRLEFREIIKKLHEMGRTILISSHILTELTDFCTSIGIFEAGTLLASGRVEVILDTLEPGLRLEVEVVDKQEEAAEILRRSNQAQSIELNGGRVRCRWTGRRDDLPELHRQLVSEDVPVVSFTAARDNLEDIYMRIAKHRTA